MKVKSSSKDWKNLLFSNIRFFLSSTSIIFFYCWIFFILYAAIGEADLFKSIITEYSYNSIFSRNDKSFLPLISFLIFYLVLLISVITIDGLFKDEIKIDRRFMLLIASVLVIRRFFVLKLLFDTEMAAGFIVGSFFYSPTAIALTPFFILYFRNNVYSSTSYKTAKGFLLISLLFIIEYIIHSLFISHSIKANLPASIANFGSYLLAFFSFVFLKKTVLSHAYFSNHILSKIILFISKVLGLPIFIFFLMFA